MQANREISKPRDRPTPKVSAKRRYLAGLAKLASAATQDLRLTIEVDYEDLEIVTPAMIATLRSPSQNRRGSAPPEKYISPTNAPLTLPEPSLSIIGPQPFRYMDSRTPLRCSHPTVDRTTKQDSFHKCPIQAIARTPTIASHARTTNGAHARAGKLEPTKRCSTLQRLIKRGPEELKGHSRRAKPDAGSQRTNAWSSSAKAFTPCLPLVEVGIGSVGFTVCDSEAQLV